MSSPATRRITSFGDDQPDSEPVRCTPINFGQRTLNGEAGHRVERVAAAHTDRDHAEPARVRRVAVGADHHPAGERVVLEHDLVDDPRAGLPEPDPVLRARGAQEVVDLRVGVERRREIGAAATRAWMR